MHNLARPQIVPVHSRDGEKSGRARPHANQKAVPIIRTTLPNIQYATPDAPLPRARATPARQVLSVSTIQNPADLVSPYSLPHEILRASVLNRARPACHSSEMTTPKNKHHPVHQHKPIFFPVTAESTPTFAR